MGSTEAQRTGKGESSVLEGELKTRCHWRRVIDGSSSRLPVKVFASRDICRKHAGCNGTAQSQRGTN